MSDPLFVQECWKAFNEMVEKGWARWSGPGELEITEEGRKYLAEQKAQS